MENSQDFVMPRPLLPNEPTEEAVYCAECEIFDQEVIGSKLGNCMGHTIPDSGTPMKCKYFKGFKRYLFVLKIITVKQISLKNIC